MENKQLQAKPPAGFEPATGGLQNRIFTARDRLCLKHNTMEGIGLSENSESVEPPNTTRIDALQFVSRESSDNHSDNREIEWRQCLLHSLYEVSSVGQIRNAKTGRILKQRVDSCGYLAVTLDIKGKKKPCRLHTLIAAAFLGDKPDGAQVDHVDCNKANNHVCNLEYVTSGENTRRATTNGLINHAKGSKHYRAKLDESQVREIKRLLPTRNNCQLGREYGVSDVAIRKIRLGLAWRHVA